jgi:hypothetical protein
MGLPVQTLKIGCGSLRNFDLISSSPSRLLPAALEPSWSLLRYGFSGERIGEVRDEQFTREQVLCSLVLGAGPASFGRCSAGVAY